mgnify:CR=1 FL=1
MIAIILAAGKGSRLLDITNSTPKSLLPLKDNYTILDYNIDMLYSLGIKTIKIVTGFQSWKIEKHIENKDIQIIYNPFWNSCNVLGSLYIALPYIEEDFIFLHADTLLEKKGWLKLINHSSKNVLQYKKKECGEEEMKIRLDAHNNLIEISKHIPHKEATGEFIGIAKFSKEFRYYCEKIAKKLFQSGELQFYMEDVISKGIVDFQKFDMLDIENAKFIEVDFQKDYDLAKIEFADTVLKKK